MTASAHPIRTELIAVDGARLHVEVRGEGPVIMLVGCPMDAAAFEPLAEHLAIDHTVITTDPRGIKRSTVVDRHRDVTPEILADDYRQIVEHFGFASVSMFGSSGGAVAALAFAQANPNLANFVIAHEPPLEELLDDRKQLRANTEDMVQTYLGGDIVGAWMKFFDGANLGMDPDGVGQWINNRTDEQEIADEAFFFANTLRPTTWWQPDVVALRELAPRIVVGVGVESAGQVCDRTSHALALQLELEPLMFPGDHTGFVDHSEAFATQLSRILTDRPIGEAR